MGKFRDGLFREIKPAGEPHPEHLTLRNELFQIYDQELVRFNGDHTKAFNASVDKIIAASKLSFAKELGMRMALKFLEGV